MCNTDAAAVAICMWDCIIYVETLVNEFTRASVVCTTYPHVKTKSTVFRPLINLDRTIHKTKWLSR